jgi:signal transduction histidine kinase
VALPGLDIGLSCLEASFATLRRGASDPLTLDLLRSDLSHESAAKIARLVAIRTEWERGRYRPEDPRDVEGILLDLQRIALRHARIASLWLGEFHRLARTLAALRAVRRTVRPVARGRVLSLRSSRRLEQEIDQLRRRYQALVSSLSDHFGARVRELVRHATDEVRRDFAGALRPEGVDIELEDGFRGTGAWIPRAERAFWLDLLRNVIRNAVEAAREKPSKPGERSVVTVRVQPAREGSGTLVEVIDRGLGMGPDELRGIWTAGEGRHGDRRGQGLTESKRAFAEARASIEVQSVRDVGTTFRIAFPFRDVPIPAAPVYRLRPMLLLALGLAAVAVLAWSLQRPPRLVSISLPTPTSIRATDANGHAWRHEFDEVVMPNTAATELAPAEISRQLCEHLIVRDERNRTLGVVIGTMPAAGPGQIWFFAPSGRIRWSRRLRWVVPAALKLGNLKAAWEQSLSWPGEEQPVVAVNMRDSDHTWTATQFFTLGGDSLGAYYHYGHLGFRAVKDFDRDGRDELLLFGINNYASQDTTFLPAAQFAYVDCVVLLEVPWVNGQSYPYTGWSGMPRACEEGYLLIPPLVRGQRASIVRIDIGAAGESGVSRIEVMVSDGRIYRLDEHLRPYQCGAGDATLADRSAPTRPIAPLAYFSYGRREAIDLLVER